MGFGPTVCECFDNGSGAVLAGLRELLGTRGQPREQDIGVPRLTELRAEPAQLIAQRRHPVAIEQSAERPQVRAQPPGSDAGLMDALEVAVQPDNRVVAKQARHPGRDRVPDHLADRCRTPRGGKDELRRCRVLSTDRTEILRGRVGRSGPSLLQTREDRLEQPLRRLLARLDLELTEHAAPARTVDHAHHIVDDVGHQASLGIVQQDTSPCRAQPHQRPKLSVTQIAPDQIDRGRRRCSAATFEHDLVADQQLPIRVARQLHRPSLARAMAEAKTPPSETKIIAVEVRSREMLFGARGGRRAVQPTELRKLEPLAGAELDLPLLHRGPLRCGSEVVCVGTGTAS